MQQIKDDILYTSAIETAFYLQLLASTFNNKLLMYRK